MPRKNGGRGIRQFEASHELTVYRTAQYMAKSAETHTLDAFSIIDERKSVCTSLLKIGNKIVEKYEEPESPKIYSEIKKRIKKLIQNNFKKKTMHGQHKQQMSRMNTNLFMSLQD